jgi:predicted phosphodiesterase
MDSLKQIVFVGDIHGKYDEFNDILEKYLAPDTFVFQVGDMGYQSAQIKKTTLPGGNWKFIHGNKDNPVTVKKHPHYAGVYGSISTPVGKMFYLGGAVSADTQNKRVGVDWFLNNEIARGDAIKAIYKYRACKPAIMVSHDCPDSIKPRVMDYGIVPSVTGKTLDTMFGVHQPKFWFFGHHHGNYNFEVNSTRFICLGKRSIFVLKFPLDKQTKK